MCPWKVSKVDVTEGFAEETLLAAKTVVQSGSEDQGKVGKFHRKNVCSFGGRDYSSNSCNTC